jgi:hypothetical protein
MDGKIRPGPVFPGFERGDRLIALPGNNINCRLPNAISYTVDHLGIMEFLVNTKQPVL